MCIEPKTSNHLTTDVRHYSKALPFVNLLILTTQGQDSVILLRGSFNWPEAARWRVIPEWRLLTTWHWVPRKCL